MGQQNRLNANFVNETTLIFGRSESIGVFNLDNNQLKFHYIPNETLHIRSVTCLSCHRNASILAVDDTCESRILLYEFPKFVCISQLKSKSNRSILSSGFLKYCSRVFVVGIFIRSDHSWMLQKSSVPPDGTFDRFEICIE